jgi:hypothetical protein
MKMGLSYVRTGFVRSIPTSQWQYKAGLTNKKPELDEEEQTYENLWEEQSFEDYYSTQESVEVNTDSEENQSMMKQMTIKIYM